MVRLKPRVDAKNMKSMATERKKTELILRFEVGQTDGTISGRGCRTAFNGAEGEERERIDERGYRTFR